MHSPFRELVVVVSLHRGFGLLEADVVEAGKRGSVDVRDSVVWNQEQLLCVWEWEHGHNKLTIDFTT